MMKALYVFGIVGVLAAANPVLAGGGALVINELRIDQGGSDVDEYFELAGAAGASLDGLTYIVIGDSSGGGSGVIEAVVDLTGSAIGASGFFVAAEDGDVPGGGLVDLITTLNFENSDNVTHMLVAGFTGASGDDLDTNDDGVLDTTPWSSMVDCISLVETFDIPASGEHIYCANTVGPDGPFVPAQAYRCDPLGDWTIGAFSTGVTDTPGSINISCFAVCGIPEAGDCFEGNGSPGCDDGECCATVCDIDQSCCADEWTQACADLAGVACRECGDSDTGGCFVDNGSPYCSDGECCDLICGMNAACCDSGWDQGCADMALANCAFNSPQCNDLVIGLSTGDAVASMELVRGPAEEAGGAKVDDDFWEAPFIQSVEFDNLDGIAHNAAGNLLGLNFGSGATGGSVFSFATCVPVGPGELIADTLGLGGDGLTQTRLGGLSVSPDNSKIAAVGFDTAAVVVYDYSSSDCTGSGASTSGARETGSILCGFDTQGTVWLDDDTVLAFSTTGEIFAVDAGNMTSVVVGTVDTSGCAGNSVVDPAAHCVSDDDCPDDVGACVDDVCVGGSDDGDACASDDDCDVDTGFCSTGCGPGFTDLEFNPDISPYVYGMFSAFSGGTTRNFLYVLDPNDGFALVAEASYSGSMETSREIAFDGDGNLFVTQFGPEIDVIVDAANLDSLADDVSLDWYASEQFASFSGIDVALCNVAVERTLIVKQGACPAPVNPNSNGVIPLLLVGDVDFDVNDVVLDSIALRRCDGQGGTATPLADHTHVADLNHPGGEVGCGECSCNDNQSSDGIGDLSMKFRTSDTLAALGLTSGDGVVTLELTAELTDGSNIVARDCVVIVPPGSSQESVSVESNVFDTFIGVTPLDMNIDSDGFASFSRSYIGGTNLTLTAPLLSNGRKFLRWSVDGVVQPFGMRTLNVTAKGDTVLNAIFQRPARLVPDRPAEGDGDLE